MQFQNKKVGVIFVLFTANNTFYSLTNFKGEVLFSISAGSQRTKNLKKTVSSVTYITVLKLIKYLQTKKFTHLHLRMKGLSKTKKFIIKAFHYVGLEILTLQDTTSFPHNGCRKKGIRRI
uniref:Ribosomal protein S11 n=1 Tax=Sheathia arcuata TaxID=340433 RepID=A0A343UY28_9FLOR|nr:ribosomal protein S11 [Sheathia arcuata]